MPAPQGSNNNGTKDRGTLNRTKPAPRATSNAAVSPASGTIVLDIRPDESHENVFARLLRQLNFPPNHFPAGYYQDYDAFIQRIRDARNTSRVVRLYFTPKADISWAQIRKNSSLIYTEVRIQNNFQVAAREKRLEEERREDEEIAQEEADRRAENERREREEQIVEEKIKKEVDTIVQKTKFWKEGTVTCRYVRGDRFRNSEFLTMYSDAKEHEDTNRAKQVENSADYHREIELALWKAYRQQSAPVIHKIPKPREEVEDKATDDKATAPLPPPQAQARASLNDCDKLFPVGTQAWYDCIKQRYRQPAKDMIEVTKKAGDTMAEIAEAVNPADPINMAGTFLTGGIFLTLKMGKAYNVLRKAGKLAQIIRKINPKRVLQLERLTTKSAKIDAELLNKAWAYRLSKAGSEEEAFFRNFMAAKIEVNGTVHYSEGLNVAKSAWHSENELQLLSRELRKEFGPNANIRVKQIYTERIPCSNCMRFLDKEFPEAEIFYAVDREADRADALFNYYYDADKL